ncbi:MAG: hypothetical protein K9G07_03205 [Aquiluna sp.]|nr:hypothetical protein [Aquiluna sp.]
MKLPGRILGIALTLAGLTGAWFFQGVSFQTALAPEPEGISVSTTAKPLQLYCQGPLAELGGKDGTDLGSMALVGKADVRYRLGVGSLVSEPESRVAQGVAIAMASREQTTATLTAAQSQLIQRPRMAGLAATNCGQPQAEGWLLNGMAGSGFESILHVANPNPVEVQIDLVFHLATSSNSHLITLAPFESQQLSLASFVEAEPNFAIYFQSSGQKVSVALQNRSSAGLSATGVELKGPTAKASKSLAIPGFQILAAGLAKPALRIFNPGPDAANALVTFLGSGTNSDVVEVEIPAAGFAEVSPELQVGDYLVLIESDAELMAELYNPYVAKNFDFAWLTPAEAFTGELAMVVPSFAAKIAIANPAATEITVLLTLDTGAQAIRVPARSQLQVPVTGKSLLLESQGEYFVNLILTDPKGYAVIAPRENQNLGSNIQVLVR